MEQCFPCLSGDNDDDDVSELDAGEHSSNGGYANVEDITSPLPSHDTTQHEPDDTEA